MCRCGIRFKCPRTRGADSLFTRAGGYNSRNNKPLRQTRSDDNADDPDLPKTSSEVTPQGHQYFTALVNYTCGKKCEPGAGSLSAKRLRRWPDIDSSFGLFQTNTRRWNNIGLMLGHRLRRWPNTKPTLFEWLVLAGLMLPTVKKNKNW